MNKRYIILSIIFFSAFGLNIYLKTQNVLYYYNYIPPKLMGRYFFNYNIINENGKWITKSVADYKIVLKKMDLKNEYFKIIDKGIGENTVIQQCALFRNYKSQPLLVICQSVIRATPITSKHIIKVFKYLNNSMQDVTSKVMPKIQYTGFFNGVPAKYFRKNKSVLKKLLKVKYKLSGKDKKIEIELDKSVFAFFKIVKPESELTPIATYLQKRLHLTGVDLFWDKRRSRFHY